MIYWEIDIKFNSRVSMILAKRFKKFLDIFYIAQIDLLSLSESPENFVLEQIYLAQTAGWLLSNQA